jgi:hypothetical protein
MVGLVNQIIELRKVMCCLTVFVYNRIVARPTTREPLNVRHKIRGTFKNFSHFLFYNYILLMITKTNYIIFLYNHLAFQHIFPSVLPTV